VDLHPDTLAVTAGRPPRVARGPLNPPIAPASTYHADGELIYGRVAATSLGGVESAIERRARYASERANGTPETLIRLSVGLEHVDDLWRDLERALTAVGR